MKCRALSEANVRPLGDSHVPCAELSVSGEMTSATLTQIRDSTITEYVHSWYVLATITSTPSEKKLHTMKYSVHVGRSVCDVIRPMFANAGKLHIARAAC